ncbi:MAG TPA: hypothetical protein VFI31_10495 [Pirellulales bacterium]|nr:hypothetical protein [Pirellulales bacterium]
MEAARMRLQSSHRPWLRLHFSTWVFLALPAALLALANIPGEYRLHWHTGKPMGCEHGWPCAWLVRHSEDLWALTRDVCYIDAAGLAADTFTALAILSCVVAAVEWRRRRRHSVWQFTLADWMVAVSVVGLPLADAANQRREFAEFNRELVAANESFYGDVQLDLPSWLQELLPDNDSVYRLAWWLARCRIGDVRCDLPVDANQIRLLRSFLEIDPDQARIELCSPSSADVSEAPPAFDPVALRSLTKLRHLTLERADEEVAACLDALHELRSLELDEECGALSEAAVHLKGLRQLRFLSATHDCLGDAGIAAIATLRTLEDLSISGASDADLAPLAALKRLRYLTLRDGSVTDAGLAHLAACTQLEELDLSGCRITGTGLAALKRLRRLRRLDVDRSDLTDDGLAGIRCLSALRELYLRGTAVEGPGLAHLGGLSRLRVLDLSDTDLDDKGFAFLPQHPRLEELSVNFTRVSEKGISAVYRTPRLKELSLMHTRFASFRGFDLNRLPELQLLLFDGSRAPRENMILLLAARPELEFSRGWRSCGLFPPRFPEQSAYARDRAAKDIRPVSLIVADIDMGDRELASMCGLPRLDAVCLQSTGVTDRGLAALLEFEDLTLVDLTKSPVGDAGLVYLAKLPRLTALDLSYTDVTPTGIARLAAFPALEQVTLDASQLTDEAMAGLEQIPKLKRLSINGDFGLWGKRYRAARRFDLFLEQLQAELPEVVVSAKDCDTWTFNQGKWTLADSADG